MHRNTTTRLGVPALAGRLALGLALAVGLTVATLAAWASARVQGA